jgi:hypothetical protein
MPRAMASLLANPCRRREKSLVFGQGPKALEFVEAGRTDLLLELGSEPVPSKGTIGSAICRSIAASTPRRR